MNFDFHMYPWTENEKKDFDCYSKIKFLAIDSNKERAKEKHKLLVYGKIKVGKNELPIKPEYPNLIKKELEYLNTLGIIKPSVNLPALPPFSFFLQFTFTLATPYLSKDDDQFYICENPIRKDKVFKVPMVAGSSWKGNMRWTASQIKNNDDVIERLFGNEKGEEEKKKFRSGRLNFYPTFFNRIGLEVINPHDRKTKAGTLPIYIESVPAKATGTFSLLYVPFDLMGKPEADIKRDVAKDLETTHCAIRAMMLTYGFSAKKCSGFGIVQNEISNLKIKPEIKNEEEKINEVKKAKAKKPKQRIPLHEWQKNAVKKVKVNQVTFDTLDHRIGLLIAQLSKPSVSGGING